MRLKDCVDLCTFDNSTHKYCHTKINVRMQSSSNWQKQNFIQCWSSRFCSTKRINTHLRTLQGLNGKSSNPKCLPLIIIIITLLRIMRQSMKGWKLKFNSKGNKRLLWFLCLTTVRNTLKRKSTVSKMEKKLGEKTKHFDK